MRKYVLFGVLGVLLLVVGWRLVDKLVVTDEERVVEAYDALRAAVVEERASAIGPLLTSDFSWESPPPINKGERADVEGRFQEFFDLAHDIAILPRGPKEITVAGGIATMRVAQIVRFKAGDMFVAWRMDAVLTFDRVGDRFVLAQVRVTDLRAGIL